MAIEKEGVITKAKVRRHDERTMILRIAVGDGEVDGEKFDIGTNASDGSPVWYFHGEKRYYTVSLRDLTEEVLRFREEIGVKASKI